LKLKNSWRDFQLEIVGAAFDSPSTCLAVALQAKAEAESDGRNAAIDFRLSTISGANRLYDCAILKFKNTRGVKIFPTPQKIGA
jgi:hypothetical protein